MPLQTISAGGSGLRPPGKRPGSLVQSRGAVHVAKFCPTVSPEIRALQTKSIHVSWRFSPPPCSYRVLAALTMRVMFGLTTVERKASQSAA